MPPNVNDSLLPQVTPVKIVRSEVTHNIVVEKTTECDCREARLGFGDAMFTSFVVAPQAVSVWRGLWGVMELRADWFPYAQVYILGIVLHVCFTLIRSQLLARSRNAWGEGQAGRWLRERLLSRIYTYVFLLACIMHWRGGFWLLDRSVDAILPDLNDPHRPVLIAAITVVLYFCIASLRSARNLLASPYFLVTDGKEPTYIFATRFQKKVSYFQASSSDFHHSPPLLLLCKSLRNMLTPPYFFVDSKEPTDILVTSKQFPEQGNLLLG